MGRQETSALCILGLHIYMHLKTSKSIQRPGIMKLARCPLKSISMGQHSAVKTLPQAYHHCQCPGKCPETGKFIPCKVVKNAHDRKFAPIVISSQPLHGNQKAITALDNPKKN